MPLKLIGRKPALRQEATHIRWRSTALVDKFGGIEVNSVNMRVMGLKSQTSSRSDKPTRFLADQRTRHTRIWTPSGASPCREQHHVSCIETLLCRDPRDS